MGSPPSFAPFPGRSPNDYIPLLIHGYSMMQAEDAMRGLVYSRKVTRPLSVPEKVVSLFRSAFLWMFK
jgi:hypothetical protein